MTPELLGRGGRDERTLPPAVRSGGTCALHPGGDDRGGLPVGRSRLAADLEQLASSARAFDRCLRVARVAADLAGDQLVDGAHVEEAIAYRLPTGRAAA